jgi:hypothetical protein
MLRSRRVKPAMTPHDEMQIMRAPATAARTDTLAAQRGGEVGIGGHARLAQLVEQETKVGRLRAPDVVGRSRGWSDAVQRMTADYVVTTEGFFQIAGLD